MLLRNNSSFLMKSRNMKKTFSTEPNNLKNLNSRRYNGLINKRVLGIAPAKDGKGVVMTIKKSKYQCKPAKAYSSVSLKHGSRRSLNTIRKFIVKGRYRKDLKLAALRKASAIIRSQRPVIVKKKAPRKKRIE